MEEKPRLWSAKYQPKRIHLISATTVSDMVVVGGSATRPLPRDGGVEKLHRDPTVGPRPKVWTRGKKWKK